MNGVDLSPLLAGKQPSKRRRYRTASYSDHVAAADDQWLLISDNRGRGQAPLPARPRRVECHARYPAQVRRLWGCNDKDAGPKGLPSFR